MNKLAVVLASVLALTGCSADAQPEVKAPSVNALGWSELQANEEYLDWLGAYCQHENLDSHIDNLDFLNISAGQTATSKLDVMQQRTERLTAAAKNASERKSILTEFADWDGVNPSFENSWSQPKSTLLTIVSNAYAESLKFLGDGTGPATSANSNVKQNWLDSCGYTKGFETAFAYVDPYEEALKSVIEAQKKSLISQGFADYAGTFLYKTKSILTTASNRVEVIAIQYSPCSADMGGLGGIDFEAPGKQGQDGVENMPFTLTVRQDLDDARNSITEPRYWAEHFYVYESDFDAPAAAKKNDFKSLTPTGVECSTF